MAFLVLHIEQTNTIYGFSQEELVSKALLFGFLNGLINKTIISISNWLAELNEMPIKFSM